MYKYLLLFSLLIYCKAFSQNNLQLGRLKVIYDSTLNRLNKLVFENGSFLESALLVENSYGKQIISSEVFYKDIKILKQLCKAYTKTLIIQKYNWRDSTNHLLNRSIYSIMKDTVSIQMDTSIERLYPFTYNFTDPFGIDNWTNTFVTKLLATHTGNCRSLTYLYKILADELGAKCWLALAPNHIYIRNYSQKIGWYNTELTSGTFPSDGWIMTTSYTNPDAVLSGLYMDTLSNQQSIALCVYDLARGYEYQTHNYYDGFILKCCDLVLKYHPTNPNALLLRAETLKKVFLHEMETKFPKPTVTRSKMEAAYIQLAKLGYRELPDKMYKKWLKKLQEEKEQYGDKTSPKVQKK